MSEEKYQGWTNWETWNAGLWLSSDEGLYNRWVAEAEQLEYNMPALAELMEANPYEFAFELTSAELTRVDWLEVAECLEE